MIKIAICDDEPAFQKIMFDSIAHDMEIRDVVYEIDTYDSGDALLECGEGTREYQVVFLDVSMGELDGIQTAVQLRNYSEDMIIIFVTAYMKYSIEGYRVNAFRYIIKDARTFEKAMEECIDAIFKKIEYVMPTYRCEFKEGERVIPSNQLIYIESNLHNALFYVMDGGVKTYSLKRTLNELEKELQNFNLIRLHQSFLVNPDYIKSIKLYQAYLKTGDVIPIPKARYKSVREKYTAYKGKW